MNQLGYDAAYYSLYQAQHIRIEQEQVNLHRIPPSFAPANGNRVDLLAVAQVLSDATAICHIITRPGFRLTNDQAIIDDDANRLCFDSGKLHRAQHHDDTKAHIQHDIQTTKRI